MALEDHYPDHIAIRRERADAALAATGFQAMVVHAGTPFRYWADDMDAPHHTAAHFAHWLPLEGPHHLLLVRSGDKPLVVRVAPEDYWYEQAPLGSPFWSSHFDVREVASEDEAWKLVTTKGRSTAYVGDAARRAKERGFLDSELNPKELIARLDWDRSFKTAYEVACIEEAQRRAARGHQAARAAFEDGASELAIHHAYVSAVGCTDKELPYETIVCHDEKGAILHYTGKRTQRDGNVLLIDAGATCNGYASDITRTWTRAGCHSGFRDLVEGMERLQRGLCEQVAPGKPYGELHHAAHLGIADLLSESGVLKLPGADAFELGLTRPFFPHGLGHFLGLQVHDVAGHQKEPAGGRVEPPAEHPFLRTTRTIEAGQVFTIEPGLYFIEMLLRPHREGDTAAHFDWELVDALSAHGGVRIEDNVLVTEDGQRNLTRPLI